MSTLCARKPGLTASRLRKLWSTKAAPINRIRESAICETTKAFLVRRAAADSEPRALCLRASWRLTRALRHAGARPHNNEVKNARPIANSNTVKSIRTDSMCGMRAEFRLLGPARDQVAVRRPRTVPEKASSELSINANRAILVTLAPRQC